MEPNQMRCCKCDRWVDDLTNSRCVKCHAEWTAEREAEDKLDEDRAIAQAAREAGLVGENGRFRKILGSLPITADGCVLGDDAEVWWRDTPRMEPKMAMTDAVRKLWDGLGGGRRHPICYAVRPSSVVYSTRSAAEAAKGAPDAQG
jgi:hypothetical protein